MRFLIAIKTDNSDCHNSVETHKLIVNDGTDANGNVIGIRLTKFEYIHSLWNETEGSKKYPFDEKAWKKSVNTHHPFEDVMYLNEEDGAASEVKCVFKYEPKDNLLRVIYKNGGQAFENDYHFVLMDIEKPKFIVVRNFLAPSKGNPCYEILAYEETFDTYLDAKYKAEDMESDERHVGDFGRRMAKIESRYEVSVIDEANEEDIAWLNVWKAYHHIKNQDKFYHENVICENGTITHKGKTVEGRLGTIIDCDGEAFAYIPETTKVMWKARKCRDASDVGTVMIESKDGERWICR